MKYGNARLQKTTQAYFRKAITKYHLLEDNEKVLVAVSGGIDSLALIHLITQYNKRKQKNWDILAVHINPGFQDWTTVPLVNFFNKYQINYLIADIYKKVDQSRFNICYVCARERRKMLFEIAEQQNIKKIAFAHHLEDVNETFFMNLIFNSKSATFLPKQQFFDGQFFIIRPLFYFDKALIRQYCTSNKIRSFNNRCPYEKQNERNYIRKFLDSLAKRNPRIKTNIFWGINNIKHEYLP